MDAVAFEQPKSGFHVSFWMHQQQCEKNYRRHHPD
jgi:hypothetical protein